MIYKILLAVVSFFRYFFELIGRVMDFSKRKTVHLQRKIMRRYIQDPRKKEIRGLMVAVKNGGVAAIPFSSNMSKDRKPFSGDSICLNGVHIGFVTKWKRSLSEGVIVFDKQENRYIVKDYTNNGWEISQNRSESNAKELQNSDGCN